MHTCVMLKGSHRKSFNVYVMKRLGCGQLYPQQAGHPAPLTKNFMSDIVTRSQSLHEKIIVRFLCR